MSSRDEERAARTAQAAALPDWPRDADGGWTMIRFHLLCRHCQAVDKQITTSPGTADAARAALVQLAADHRAKYKHGAVLMVFRNEERPL